MRRIGSNLIYLWNHLSSWLRLFIIVSFSLIFLLFAVGSGFLFAVAAVGGATMMMIGIIAIGLLQVTNPLFSLLSFAAIFVLAFGLRACGLSDEIAGLGAVCITGWVVVLYLLSSYEPST